MSQFFATKKMFANIIGVDNENESLSYESWMAIPDSYKSAALFVNFYPAIKAAWESAKGDGVDEEDGIECVLQYLEKNVEKIKKTKNKYTHNYIYAVAWNSMGCLRRVKKNQLRFKFECSNIVLGSSEDSEVDLFDTVSDPGIDVVKLMERERFWETIESLFIPKDSNGNLTEDSKIVLECRKYEKVINHLLNGDSLSKARDNVIAENPDNPLLSVSVSRKEKERIIEDLRKRLSSYKDTILGTDLVPATDEDLVPTPIRKKSYISEEIYAYLCKQSKLTTEEAIRLFAVTSDSFRTMMRKFYNVGRPIKAHWVKDDHERNGWAEDYYYVVD